MMTRRVLVRAVARPSIAGMVVACALAMRIAPLGAEDPAGLDLKTLRNGNSALPLPWKAYRPVALPPVDLRNGAGLLRHLADRSLRLSERGFLQLVVENNLDLLAARYNFAISHVDVLRAHSGQAARGVASAPLPAAVFAGAIGAGVSTTVPLSAGGTGGAAISTQGKLVAIGPRGVFDPTVNVNLSYDRLINPLNTVKVAGVRAVTVPSTVLQTRFQQELPEGTSYSVSFNLQRQASTQAGLLFNPALTSFGSIQLYQPLLNGFGLPLTQRFVTLAENNTKIVTEAFHSMLNDTLSNAANAYWDLVAMRENLRAAQEAATAAEQQRDEDRARVDVGVMTGLDALASESQFAAARVQVVQARTSVDQQEVVVKTMISRRSDPALDATTIEPTDALPGPERIELESTDRSIATALARRSSIRQALLSLQNQHIAEEYTRKNLLPVLSLYAQVNVYGLAPDTPRTLRQLVRLNYPEYSVGVTWSLPIFNRAAAADDVRARLETQQSEVSLQRTRQQVTLQVQNATEGVVQNHARVNAAARARSASRTAYEGEQLRLTAGLSTPYRVLLALRDLTVAEAADVQARVNYAKAIVAYEVAVGSLLERNGIDADAAMHGTMWAVEP